MEESQEVTQQTIEPEAHVETQNDVENDHFEDESLPPFGRAAPEPVRIQSGESARHIQCCYVLQGMLSLGLLKSTEITVQGGTTTGFFHATQPCS